MCSGGRQQQHRRHKPDDHQFRGAIFQERCSQGGHGPEQGLGCSGPPAGSLSCWLLGPPLSHHVEGGGEQWQGVISGPPIEIEYLPCTGCLLHRHIPLRGSDHPARPWSHAAWRHRGRLVLHHTKVVRAPQPQGEKKKVQSLIVFRCGTPLLHSRSSPSPPDLAP